MARWRRLRGRSGCRGTEGLGSRTAGRIRSGTANQLLFMMVVSLMLGYIQFSSVQLSIYISDKISFPKDPDLIILPQHWLNFIFSYCNQKLSVEFPVKRGNYQLILKKDKLPIGAKQFDSENVKFWRPLSFKLLWLLEPIFSVEILTIYLKNWWFN